MTEPNNNPPPPPPSDAAPAQPPPPYVASPTTNAQQAPAPLSYGTAGAPPYMGPAPTSDDRTMAILAHVLGIITSFLGPLIIWLVKKDTSPFVDDQGKEALNFQITLLIGYAVSAVATLICIGPILAIALSVVAIVFGILGAVAVSKGEAYRYPFNIRLIK